MIKTVTLNYPNDSIALPPMAIALGFFDGVHTGHRLLIERLKNEARRQGLCTAIFTFPSESEDIKSGAARIYSTDEKLALLCELGMDYVILADFRTLADETPEAFVSEHLCKALNCHIAVVGYNFRFGRGACADARQLLHLMQKSERRAIIVPEQKFEGAALSATEIRAALAKGDCERAAKMLARPYRITATVEHGQGLGRRFGFPTLNTRKNTATPLPRGVYATVAEVEGERFVGVTNLGVCPTFGNRDEHFETMLLDFDKDIYGEQVIISFISRLRDEESFSSPELLKAQIDRDALRARELATKFI